MYVDTRDFLPEEVSGQFHGSDTLQGRQVGPQDCSDCVTWFTAVSKY